MREPEPWETSTLFDRTVAELAQHGMPVDQAVSMTLDAIWVAEKLPRKGTQDINWNELALHYIERANVI